MSSEKYTKNLEYTAVVERMLLGSGLKNESSIAKALDISPQALSNFKARGEFPADRVIQFALQFKLSVDWLLAKEGADQKTPTSSTDDRIAGSKGQYGNDYVLVPQLSGNISAGGGLVPDNFIEMKIAFRREWIQRRGDPAHMSLIRVSGDSMEPTLLSGDLVLVDHGRNYVDPYGGLYAIAIDSTIMIKRIQMMFPEGKIKIISDNSRYDAIVTDPDRVKVNGKVIWFGREIEK